MRKYLNIFVTAAALLCGTAGATVLNEWTFEADPSGRTLSQAVNSGTDVVSFGADTLPVTQTDGAGGLVCNYNSAGAAATLWTNGPVLLADVVNSATNETRYLRYDVKYDMTSTNNNSGTLLALAFMQGAQTHLAGFALKYRIGDPAPPTGVTEAFVKANLALTGSLAVIAEVNLTAQTMKVWYNLSGGNTFTSNAPDTTVSNLTLTAIEQLEFRATGDFIPGSSNCVVVGNIRTASSWEEITDPVADYDLTPVPLITLFDDQMGGAMIPGQTNTVRVVIKNTVSLATNVSSTLSFNGAPGDFTIISNNLPVAVGANRLTTNTYQVVAHTDGQYVFTARAVSDGVFSAPADLSVLVGTRITAGLFALTNEVGGLLVGRPEPGERFELVITNWNNGGVLINNITNSLTAENAAYFPTIIPGSSPVYSSLGVGATATTTYRVTCSSNAPGGLQTFSIVNRIDGKAWTNQFQIDVFRASLLQATNALTIRVVPGEAASANLTLLNAGNSPTSFKVTDDGRLTESYTVTSQSVARIAFGPADFSPQTVFSAWSGASTVPLDIGFDVKIYGTAYKTFSANQAGFLTLTSTNGTTATLTPFNSGANVAQSTVRYARLAGNRLVVAWGNGTGHEFQAILNSDGTVQYLYQYATWGAGQIGLSNSNGSGQTIPHTPGKSGQDALLLTAAPWLSVTPATGTISGYSGSQTLTFSVQAPAAFTGIKTTTVTIAGGDNTVTVNVSVSSQLATSRLIIPSSFAFSGPAGSISPPAFLTVSNSGNVAVSYVLSDGGMTTAGYTSGAADYQWQDIPDVAEYRLSASALGTTPVEIGFPFMFYGNLYTNLIVQTNGTLWVGTWSILPYAAGLTYDENTVVRVLPNVNRREFTVTWENISQTGGGADQTFQAVLDGEGQVRINYKQLSGNWWTAANWLINADTRTYITNVTYTTGYVTNWSLDGIRYTKTATVITNTAVVATYVDPLVRQSYTSVPGKARIITFSPVSGTILPGNTADITLRGDARSLTAGGASSVLDSTTLTFTYPGGPRSTTVSFTATNSVESVFSSPAVQSAMWGTANPVVSSQSSADGSRTLSWPAADDAYGRVYTVWYTTRLTGSWAPLGSVTNLTEYVDRDHSNEPVIFYRVTVE